MVTAVAYLSSGTVVHPAQTSPSVWGCSCSAAPLLRTSIRPTQWSHTTGLAVYLPTAMAAEYGRQVNIVSTMVEAVDATTEHVTTRGLFVPTAAPRDVVSDVP